MSVLFQTARPPHPVDADTEEVLNRIRYALHRAYDKGKADGVKETKEAANEALQLINNAIGEAVKNQKLFTEMRHTSLPKVVSEKGNKQRASKGSAKSLVLQVLQRGGPWGYSTQGMAEELERRGSAVKYNTLRGTLWRMTQDDEVERQQDRWVLKKKPPVEPAASEGVA